MAHFQSAKALPNGSQARLFDPKALLTPKVTASKSQASSNGAVPSDGRWQKPTANAYGAHAEAETEPSFQFGSTMEKLHNVEQRSERPVKKIKHQHQPDFVDVDGLEDEEGGEKKKKANFSRGGTGGEVSEYMKQQREEGHKEAVVNGSVVDLTSGKVNRVKF